jgi:site-specific DNA-methyltransferase (adenine-specific)
MKIEPNSFICANSEEMLRDMEPAIFDLCLTDPPYGIEWKPLEMFGKKCPQAVAVNDLQQWDHRPSAEHFQLIRRVSKHQIVWGGNYFADYLGAWRAPLVWDKKTGNNSYADGELAWTSFSGTMRICQHQWCGAFKDSERGIQNVHPTQKPIAVFVWCLLKFTQPGDLVIDPFSGSGTTALACHKTGRRFVCIERDRKYHEIAQQRYADFISQQSLFGEDAPAIHYGNGDHIAQQPQLEMRFE